MSDTSKDVASVTRRRGRSGVGYATADVAVHETRNRRILLQPWYIHHNTRPDELAIKLISQVPAAGAGWTQEGELNLDEDAVGRLRAALDAHAEAARAGEEGEFLLIRAGCLARTSEAAPGELVRAVLQLLGRRDVLDQFIRRSWRIHAWVKAPSNVC